MMPYLDNIKILKIILYAIFLWVWCTEGILSNICLIYPLFLWWIDIHHCCHYMFPHRNHCDRYFYNSIERINMARPKPIITVSHDVICVKFSLLFVRVWKYLISLSIVLVGPCPLNRFLLHLDCSCGIILDNKYLRHNMNIARYQVDENCGD